MARLLLRTSELRGVDECGWRSFGTCRIGRLFSWHPQIHLASNNLASKICQLNSANPCDFSLLLHEYQLTLSWLRMSQYTAGAPLRNLFCIVPRDTMNTERIDTSVFSLRCDLRVICLSRGTFEWGSSMCLQHCQSHLPLI